MAPAGVSKDERMGSFIRCVTALLGKMLYIDDTAMIAPINITDDTRRQTSSRLRTIPSNFTKLGKHIMISGGSWVFNKKEKGSNNVYGRFRLKSQIPTEDIINCMSFEFSRVGGKIFKKQHQAMETEMPLMLLFICNGTDYSSILSDTRQMLNLAYDDIKTNRMMPEEFNNKDIPEFSLRVNVPRMASNGKKTYNKAFDDYSNQGKKAFHFEVAKEDVAYFKYLSRHAHRLRLNNKFFRKFAKFTATLSNSAPMSDCVSLRRCIQGHLNFHLSSTLITIHALPPLPPRPRPPAGDHWIPPAQVQQVEPPGAGRQIVATDLPSMSARRESKHAQRGLCSERVTLRRRRNQQRALRYRRKEADSRQRQLLETCMKIKSVCINGSIKTTNHNTIMEQLRIRAERFRKQGRLWDEDVEKIIANIKANNKTTEEEADKTTCCTSDNENRWVMEAVEEEGLLQVHGTAPNTKQQGIFRILGENCNGFNNRIGNNKLAKALEIKEDLDIPTCHQKKYSQRTFPSASNAT
jgi:hypothetical protein